MTPILKPCARKVRCRVPHGVNPWLVITLYQDGIIGIRELKRRKETELQLSAALLYVRSLFMASAGKQKRRKHGRR